jgi:hypothetical protein
MAELVVGESNVVSTISEATIHLVRGADQILRLQKVLAGLSVRCGQAGVLNDIGYFLSKPGTLDRVPHLLLLSRGPVLDIDRLTEDHLLGAVLLYRYKVLGCGIGIFTTNDRSGRGTLVAPAALRCEVAERVSRRLMEEGALAVLISFREEEAAGGERSAVRGAGPGRDPAVSGNEQSTRWAWRERQVPDYLTLENTYDATLGHLGQRTRRNMRYYRRRAEAELGCVFLSDVAMGKKEFLEFNRECMYAVPSRVAAWRFESLKGLDAPVFTGLKDRAGRWLSLLGGRRYNGGMEILWQMNRDGLSTYSLSIVMRSYFMEHAIAGGSTKLYMEGGFSHPMRNSFVQDKVTDLVVMRRSRLGRLMPRIAKLFVKPDNELALMLLDKSLYSESPEKSEVLPSAVERGQE